MRLRKSMERRECAPSDITGPWIASTRDRELATDDFLVFLNCFLMGYLSGRHRNFRFLRCWLAPEHCPMRVCWFSGMTSIHCRAPT
jgi:hypothetical protein